MCDAFVFRRKLHVVVVQAGQIGVVLFRSGKVFVFELHWNAAGENIAAEAVSGITVGGYVTDSATVFSVFRQKIGYEQKEPWTYESGNSPDGFPERIVFRWKILVHRQYAAHKRYLYQKTLRAAEISHPVYRKNVDPHAFVFVFKQSVVYNLRSGIDDFGKFVEIFFVGTVMQKFEMAVRLACEFYEFVVVGSEHADVDVVVPWYEPLVPYGTEECPVRQKIAYAVFPAYVVNVFQNGQFDVFDFGRGYFLHVVFQLG